MPKRGSRHVDSHSDPEPGSSSPPPSVVRSPVRTGKKRRRLANSLKKLKEEMTLICLSVERFQRNVTSEINELKNAILQTRPFPTSTQGENLRNLKLQCKTKLPQRVYTGSNLGGDQGTGIDIILIDADTNQIITTGIESSIKVQAVALEGDFSQEEHENWPREEFDRYIVKERKQRRPLLIGDLQVTLKEGAGNLNNLIVTDNSSWNRSRMFRIGVQVASGYCEGTRIREAFTEPFVVLEQRGESNKKNDQPESNDYVWRLKGIGKGGPFHKKLEENEITNVEEFLRAYARDQHALRNILGSGMTTGKWNSLIDHAKTCPPNGKLFVYYPGAERNYGLIFDNFACLAGLIVNGVPQWIKFVSDSEKQGVGEQVKMAHRNWKDVTEYDGPREFDPLIERGIFPHAAAKAVIPGNHRGILPGHSLSLPDFPIQISIGHVKSSMCLNSGLAGQQEVNASSSLVAEQGSTSQQISVQAGEASMPRQQYTSSSYHFSISSPPSPMLFNADELHTISSWDSFDWNMYFSDLANTNNNLQRVGSFASVSDPSYSSSSKDKAVIRWFKVKAVLKWGFIHKKRSKATLREL
ncbi:hypothetical protein MLD38_021123 [Melastoma candidum]|uniref:Uncharacterized protein n=1 Tax=Melastoma candidum TaxID=119954 RepID=A0ACB9QIH2_9MYRT|nr:hypothetical protein MLD38_021123 [Melastoma candidum]